MSEQPVVLHVRPATVADGVASLSPDGGDALSVTSVTSREAALDAAAATDPDYAVCDHDPDAGLDGLAVLDALADERPDLPVLLCTDAPDGSVAAEATRLGATEYVPRSETDPMARVRDLAGRRRDRPEPDRAGSAASLPADLSASFDAVASSVADAVVTINADSEIVYANAALAELCGYDREALLGEPFTTLIPEHLRAAHLDGVARYLDTGERTVDWDYLELPLITADGSECTAAVSFGDFERDGEWYCTGVVRDISERKAREKRLEDTNRRLDLALDGTDTGVYEWDLVTEEVVLDEATANLFGTTPEAFGGTADAFRERVHPEDRADVERALTTARETGDQYDVEFRVPVDGETRWIHSSGVVEDRDAQPPRLVAIATDVTEQKERERELRTNNEALRALTRLATRDDLSETETIDAVLELGADRLGTSLGYVSRIEDGEYEVLQVVGDHEVVEEGATTDLANTYCKRIAETAESLTVLDAASEGWEEEPAYRMSGLSCYFGGAIRVGGELYGTLCFADEEPREEPFTEAQRTFVELLVEWVGRELERRRREDELERYADIIEAVDDGVYALDSEGHFEFVNGAMTDLTGHDKAALLGSHTGFIKDEATVQRAESLVREMVVENRDGETSFDLEIQRADGTAFPAEDHMTLLYDDERFVGTAGVIRDITEQKERDEKLSGLLDTSRSLMQAHTATEVAETVVEAAETQLGFDLNLVRLHDPEEAVLVPVAGSETLPERPEYDADEAFPGEAFQRGETVRVGDFDEVETYDNRRANAAMYVPIGDHGVLSVATVESEAFDDADVSVAEILASNAAAALDRVEREEDLLRYETVVENVRDMVYVLDEDGTFQLVTEPLAEWLGFDRAALLGERPSAVLDDRSIAAFERRIRALQREGGGSFQIETSMVTAEGTERPAEIEVSLIDGEAFRGTVGVVRDLTELKQAREELRDERDRFSYLFNNLPDAVVETEVADDRQTVRSVNPAFADVFGFDHADLIGRELSDLLVSPSETGREETDRLAEVDAPGETVQAEVRRRTDQGFRDFLFRGVPYRRDDGRLWGFGIYTDITDQRERERRLEVLNRVLRHNLRNDLTVVMGLADELAERLDDPERLSLVDRLQRKAADVAAVSDRARDIERAVRREDAGTEPVDVPEAVASLVATYDDGYAGTVEATVPSVPARAADGRFTRVVGELLENGLEHAGPEPTITVSVAVSDERVTVTVADDGEGIPDHELDVVTGDEPITQLSHGSGLGLWLVTWVTESYGGTVTFGESADGGASVTLTLPRTDT